MSHLHIQSPDFPAKTLLLFPHFYYNFVIVAKQVTGSGHSLCFSRPKIKQIMSSNDMIREAFKDFLKPIITEAIAEANQQAEANREPRYYTREEVCKRLRIGTTTFYRLANKGKIRILKVAGKTLVDADELDEAVETRQVYRYQH